MKIAVIVVAAGAGKRMGAGIPKAFMPLGGRPLFSWCLDVFKKVREVWDVVLVLPPGRVDRTVRRFGRDLMKGGVTKVVCGGARRQDSVGRGLEMADPDCDVVLVHDAARPFLTPALVRSVARAARRTGAAVPGLPSRDTIKRVKGGRVVDTPDRSSLFAVQTPQGVRADLLRKAYRTGAARKDATDDVQLVERMGGRVAVVAGEARNFKITSREDLVQAEYLLTRC